MKFSKNLLTSLLLLVLFFAIATASDDSPWMDMANCQICTNITAQEGLMQNMSWEHHLTATGMLTVSTIKPDYVEKYEAALEGMKAIQKKMMTGESVDICNFCSSITGLLKDGAMVESFETQGAKVMVLSSKDDAMIDRIHTHGQKTIDFMAAMHKQMMSEEKAQSE